MDELVIMVNGFVLGFHIPKFYIDLDCVTCTSVSESREKIVAETRVSLYFT